VKRRNTVGWLATSLMFAGLMLPQTAIADGWGHLTGRLVFDGDLPKLKLKVTKGDATVRDPKCCAAQNVPDDSLVVNPKNKGIAHAFVYLKKVSKAQIHPELVKSKKPTVEFDQKGCQFKPHAMVVRMDQRVVVLSDDPIPHNTHSFPILNKGENFIVSGNDRIGVTMPAFVIKEPLPFEVRCDIHGWMSARWLVVDHPYATVTDADGKFKLENMPEGDLNVTIWHERVGYIKDPDGNKSFKVTISSDKTTELDEIAAPAKSFEDD